MSLRSQLLQTLWVQYGNPKTPSEWDGSVYGGGKLSQRYWEYHIAYDMLGVSQSSVVLDIGGASPRTGVSLFASILAEHVRKVIVVDPNVPSKNCLPTNLFPVPAWATRSALMDVFAAHPDITHVTSISVMEHIEEPVRIGIIEALEDCFHGESIVLTLEYHAQKTFFEQQLNTRSLSRLVSPLKSWYPHRFEKCPVHCEDAYSREWAPFYARFLRKMGLKHFMIDREYTTGTPLWYPLALEFRRCARGLPTRS